MFRELEFSLKDIKTIIDSPNFDRNKALEQQIELLTRKKEHLDNLILFARGIKMIGVTTMDFSVFDTSKIDEYAKSAKEQWGKTPEYKEFEEKSKARTDEEEHKAMENFMQLFVDFGRMKALDPSSKEVQEQVGKLQGFINENFYQCSDEILLSLGQMYAGGGEFTENIDKVGGSGTAVFTDKAIKVFCAK